MISGGCNDQAVSSNNRKQVPYNEWKNLINKLENHVVACFEQSQTVGILNYLTVQDSTIKFQSHLKEQKKKCREFQFNSIFVREGKMRNTLGGQTSAIVEALVEGRDQAMLLYGMEESFKQKLLYGEPRDPGLMLLFMEQLFTHCHKLKLEQQVTVKISFASYDKGRFVDLLVNSKIPLKLCKDSSETGYLLGQSEIIVRNLKTAIKIIRIANTNYLSNDQDDDLGGECMIFEVKLQIESEKGSERYQISKFKMVKFADPSLNQLRKGGETMKINDRNRWAINLDNCLRQRWMLDHPPTKHTTQKDDLTTYLRPIFEGEIEISCYITLTNKLSQNDCLNCLIFSYYVSMIECQTKSTVLDVTSVREQIRSLEGELVEALQELVVNHPQCKIEEIERALKSQMDRRFDLECQFSKLLSSTCSSLAKYIMNGDVGEFFYCKRQGINGTPDICRLLELVTTGQEKIEQMMNILTRSRAIKDLGKTKAHNIERLFELYRTACLYFFYQRHEMFNRNEGRRSTLRNSRLSLQRLQSRDNQRQSNFRANINPYATQQNLRIRKHPIKLLPPAKTVAPSSRQRPIDYEDYVKAMFFNQSISAW